MCTFVVELHLKTNQTQFSLRATPEMATPLWSCLPDLKSSVASRKSWSHPGKVQIAWNNSRQYEATFSYYPAAGYVEFNINQSTPLHNRAERWELDGKPLKFFEATFTNAQNQARARINLVEVA